MVIKLNPTNCGNSIWFFCQNSNRSDEVFQQYIDKVIDLNTVIYPNGQRTKIRSPEVKPLRISQVIESCHQNHSIYKVSCSFLSFFFQLILMEEYLTEIS